uniref:Uncharacterized protein n=1 Tax=Anguilla anguilla TaxID=7936 RepID=A0A0E9UPV9_ANGAN
MRTHIVKYFCSQSCLTCNCNFHALYLVKM